jgi:hypothetical protein
VTNRYLEKIAEDHMITGWISPAMQEKAIARDHGKEGLTGNREYLKKALTGTSRVIGRGLLEGAVGGAVGGAAGLAAGVHLGGTKEDAKLKALIGGLAGMYGAYIHGVQSSLRNQAAEAHKKYS